MIIGRWLSLVRRRRERRVAQRLRELFAQRALASDLEPVSIAAAYAWAYDEVQRVMPRASRRVTPDAVDEMTSANMDFATHMSLMGLTVQRPAIISHAGEMRRFVAEEVHAHDGAALDELIVLHAVADECCERFHGETSRVGARYHALMRLATRALLISDEIVHLLLGGYPSGALARWRSLHEVCVIAALLEEHDDQLAERYLDHEAIGRAKGARSYQDHAPSLGEAPLPPQTLAEIEAERRDLITGYGKAFATEYGWAAEVVHGPNLRTLEAHTGRARLRPYYQLASHPVHAGARNLLNEIGIDDHNVLLAGPSTDGLTDPIQLAALSLVDTVSSLLRCDRDDPSYGRLIQIDALEQLRDNIINALQSERDTPHSRGPVRSPLEEGRPPLLAWPALSWSEVQARGVRPRLRRALQRDRS